MGTDQIVTYVVGFVSGISVTLVSERLKHRWRRKNLRTALWRIVQHELRHAGEAERIFKTAQAVATGKRIEGSLIHLDATEAIEREAIAVDHSNALAYLKLRGHLEATGAAIERLNALTSQLTGGDKACRNALLVAAAGAIDSYEGLANARLTVLRVLQHEEPDPSVRSRVLQEAERDAKDVAGFQEAIRSLLSITVPGASPLD